MTTSHLQDEPAVRELLSIPEDVFIYCIIPIGYALGRWGEAQRKPVEAVAYRNAWGNPFESPARTNT